MHAMSSSDSATPEHGATAAVETDNNNNNNNNKDETKEAANNQAVKLVEQPKPPGLTRFEQQMLDSHNAYRGHHSAAPLIACPELAQRAQRWAETLAARNNMWHADQRFDGENLAMIYNSARTNFPGQDFVNMWYYEGLHYRFPGTQLGADNTNGRFVTGHFSQLVWKNSKRVGFGRAVSKTGRVYVVARYRPPGNVIGWFNANVLPPKDGKLRCRYVPQ